MANEKVIELMKPRYKVIAPYPNSPFKAGQILIRDDSHENNYWTGEQCYTDRYPDQYPHLFKPLQWWEDRKPEEMPEYVRIEEKVYKIREWENYFGLLPHEDNPAKDSLFKVEHYFNKGVPATLEDYQQYLTTK